MREQSPRARQTAPSTPAASRWTVARTTYRFLALALVTVLSHAPQASASFPPSPQTLWELTHEARLIVWADVENVSALPKSSDDPSPWGDNALATLKVREAWKGSGSIGEHIKVLFTPEFPCNTQVQFRVGLKVVAFLEKVRGQWSAGSLFCGTRFPASDSDVDAYRRVVTAARQALDRWTQARLAGEAPDFEKAHWDWRVLAAVHPVTRWDGVFGLAAEEFDAVRSFYNPRASPDDTARVRGYREELAHDIVAFPSFDPTFALLLKLLRGFPSKDVNRVVANVLETVATENPPPHWAILAFELLRERLGESPAPGVTQVFVREWPDFKQRHGLKPQPIHPPAK
ncbi:hypothetical protein ACN469_02315 [Corallococcus terminator]